MIEETLLYFTVLIIYIRYAGKNIGKNSALIIESVDSTSSHGLDITYM